jgi:hypothetical protein
VNPPTAHGGFAHHWQATILSQRPLILPRRHYVYPREAEEVERGALELLITPAAAEPFLATCALGFADPLAPSGVWTCPHPAQLCAVAGGYAYLIDTRSPERFEQIAYRPVLAIYAAHDPDLLLFAGSYAILAYDAIGRAWQSPRLSDEGLEISTIAGGLLHGSGWHMRTDREMPFTIALNNGRLHVSSGQR